MTHKTLTIGQAIEALRKEQGLTLEKLASAFSLTGNLDTKQLRKIINGTTEPTGDTLARLVNALGLTLEGFYNYQHGLDPAQFNADVAAIYDAGFAGDFALMGQLFDTLREKPYANTDIPHIDQTMLLIDGVLAVTCEDDLEWSITTLLDALSITAPHLTSGKMINLDALDYRNLTTIEFYILKEIGTTFAQLKNIQLAVDIYKALVSQLEKEDANYEICKRILPTLYFNLSNQLLNDAYRSETSTIEASTFVDKGIEACQKYHDQRVFEDLLWNQGRTSYYLQDLNSAQHYFQQSCDLSQLLGNNQEALRLIAIAKDKYGINLSSHF